MAKSKEIAIEVNDELTSLEPVSVLGLEDSKTQISGMSDESIQKMSEIKEEAPENQAANTQRQAYVRTVDGGRSELTFTAKRRNDLIDLSESLKGRHIMTSKLHGIENAVGDPENAYAVLYHGCFKVIIPANEVIDYEEADERASITALISKRLGAEIDYIVKGIDEPNDMAVASRKEAMTIKRRIHYFSDDGLKKGDLAEARIVSTIWNGIFVEVFGVEVFIPIEELSYQRRVDATQIFRTGERTLVKILELEKSEDDTFNVSVILSVRQTTDDTLLQALDRYNVDDRYFGTVTMITPAGIFVSLEDGLISCLCSFPARGRPHINANVTVKIRGISKEEKRIWGSIIHSS